ncbi:MAG: TolB family protein [Fimbriimonadales bacterium]
MITAVIALTLAQAPTFDTNWQIAFQRGNGIWVSRADGKGLTRVAVHGQNPRWSRDGKRLAYYRDGQVRIFDFATRRDAGAGKVAYKPDDPSGRCYIDWDPLTSVILCASISGAGIQLIGAGASILTQGGNSRWLSYCPRWSPSGRELAFARNGDIWLAHRDVTQVSAEPVDYYGDANRLAPLAVFNDTERGASVATPFWVDELEWTRDEKRLVFHFQRQGGSGVSEIGYLDLRKAARTNWRSFSGFSYEEHWILGKDKMAFSPRICPDGTTLSCVSYDDGDPSLYVCSWDGKAKRKVLKDVQYPDWRPVSTKKRP